MNKKNGFTLIELLAVLIVLSLIAVITVPVVLNILDNSKKDVFKNSAHRYVDAVNKYYVSNELNHVKQELPNGYKLVSELPSDFSVSGDEPTSDSWLKLENGEVIAYSLKFGDYVVTKYTVGDPICLKGDVQENEEEREIRLAREATISSANAYISALENLSPKIVTDVKTSSRLNDLVTLESEASSGWVEFGSDGNAIKYSLRFGDYVVNYDSTSESNQNIVSTGDILLLPIPGMIFSDGTKYHDTIWIKEHPIKYNPGHVAVGNTAAVAPQKCISGEDCKTWYVYSEFIVDGQIYLNMILDRNTTSSVACLSKSDWTNPPANTGISYPSGTTFDGDKYGSSGNNKKGPLTALIQLHEDTDLWNLSNRIDSYTPVSNAYSNYTIDYSGYKARLISAEEISRITGKNTPENFDSWDLSGNWYYLGLLNTGNGSSTALSNDMVAKQHNYSWMFDYTNNCTNWGCEIADSSGNGGYWTSSPSLNGSSHTAQYIVGDRGYLNYNYGMSSTYIGIRPVITILASEIF